MRLVTLAVATFILLLTGDVRAGGDVDWSAYIDKDGRSKLPASKTPTVGTSNEVAAADDDDAAKPTAKRGARVTKAKTKKSKAKVKPRAKAKKKSRK